MSVLGRSGVIRQKMEGHLTWPENRGFEKSLEEVIPEVFDDSLHRLEEGRGCLREEK